MMKENQIEEQQQTLQEDICPTIQIQDKNYKIFIQYLDSILLVKVIDKDNDIQNYQGKFSNDNIPNSFKFFGEELVIPTLFKFLLKNPKAKIYFDGKGNLILKLLILQKVKQQALPLQKVKNSVAEVKLIKDEKITRLTKQNLDLHQTIKLLIQMNAQLQNQLSTKQNKIKLLSQQKIKLADTSNKISLAEKTESIEKKGINKKQEPQGQEQISQQTNISNLNLKQSKLHQFIQDNDWLQIPSKFQILDETIQQLTKYNLSSVKQIHIDFNTLNSSQFLKLFSKKWNNLNSIWMQGNQIKTITSLNLSNMPKLIHISLNWNPLDNQSRQYLKGLQRKFGRPTVSMDKQLVQ